MKPLTHTNITHTKGRRTPRHLNGVGGCWGLPFPLPGGLRFGCGSSACCYISAADGRWGYGLTLLYTCGMFADMVAGRGS